MEKCDHQMCPFRNVGEGYTPIACYQDGCPVRAYRDDKGIALKTIAEYPITDPQNMDAMNMQQIAARALR